ELIEQRIVTIVGYRKKMWGELCCEVYGADVVVYGGRIGDVEGVCGAARKAAMEDLGESQDA
ncbi:hypothetical protein Tco_1063874, partial [Tanacetum coccineum]